MKASLVGPPNQCCERSFFLSVSDIVLSTFRFFLARPPLTPASAQADDLVGIVQKLPDRAPRGFGPAPANRRQNILVTLQGRTQIARMASRIVEHVAQRRFDQESQGNEQI